MKKYALLLMLLSFTAITFGQKKFSSNALSFELELLDASKTTFGDIIKNNKGKNILIDVWASWCPDCIKGLPDLFNLQKENPEIIFLFVNMDKTTDKWKAAINKYNLNGVHVYAQGGMKSTFGSAIKLDWIPRYILVNKKGEIEVFKAITADDKNLENAIKKLK